MRTFWPLLGFSGLMMFWFAYDGWFATDPSIREHETFNRVMTLLMLAPVLASAWLVFRTDPYANMTVSQPLQLSEPLSRWNFGAFFLAPLWGLGNRVYWAVLTIIPYMGWPVAAIAGFRGNEFALRSIEWRSEEEFLHVQRIWNQIPLYVIGYVAFVVLAIVAYSAFETRAV